jgi:hypothetical protein
MREKKLLNRSMKVLFNRGREADPSQSGKIYASFPTEIPVRFLPASTALDKAEVR